jgi:hypothetical protein
MAKYNNRKEKFTSKKKKLDLRKILLNKDTKDEIMQLYRNSNKKALRKIT